MSLVHAHITNALWWAAKRIEDRTGIPHHLISATRSLRPGGATALLCANVDKQSIQLLGQWKSDAMLRYLHVHSMNATQWFSAAMLKHGAFTFDHMPEDDPSILPRETLSIFIQLSTEQLQ